MTDFDLTVDTRDLRAALMSVMPHAGLDPDLPTLLRIRAYVVQGGMVMAATDRFTGALAKVELEDRSAELGCFDLHPQDAREILTLFKPIKDIPHTVRLEHDGKQFQVTDVSGLFPGKSVRFEAFALDQRFPDLANLIGHALRAVRPNSQLKKWRSGYSVTGSGMAKFSAAGKAYGMPLSVEPTSALPPALVVTCGEEFAGLLIPGRRDDDEEVFQAGVREGWAGLAADVSMTHPIQPEVRKARDAQSVVDLSDLLADPEESSDPGGDET